MPGRVHWWQDNALCKQPGKDAMSGGCGMVMTVDRVLQFAIARLGSSGLKRNGLT
jgi:hypothetical protein